MLLVLFGMSYFDTLHHKLILCLLLLGFFIPVLFFPLKGADAKVDDGSVICQDLTDGIVALCIYQVKNGQTTVRVFSGTELKTHPSIQMEGYISGVVLLSTSSIEASVAGRPLRKLPIQTDGSFDSTSYDKFESDVLKVAFRNAEHSDFDFDRMNHFAWRYAWFPTVPGDPVCTQNRFSIILNDSRQSLEIPVFHTETIQLNLVSAESDNTQYKMDFRYSGNDPEQFEIRDFETRVRAIAEGVRAVELIVGQELVTSVNLLDYDGIYNALTCDGRNEIWFYTDIFWKESPEELRTIAEHETLHILVDQGRLTKNTDLRELFADLRGMDDLSMDRFALMTAGVIPSGARRTDSKTPDHILFAFINEMNFFKGKKGGHSRDGLEEFCVSFLHTLMYPDNLDQNLKSPVILPGGDLHILTTHNQMSLLADYLMVVEKLMRRCRRKSCGENPGRLFTGPFGKNQPVK
jgi:hypothetical protein